MKIFNKISIAESTPSDLYQYKCFIKSQSILTNDKCSYWYINDKEVGCFTGNNQEFNNFELCVEILGYTPETRTSTYSRGTDLPYLNGCSTKQLIPANRLGDPTWQLLNMSPNSTEQKHHIHSTARIVYVLKGNGKSIIGNENDFCEFDLNPGDVLILPKMEAHHFESGENGLIVAPLHIFSSNRDEFNHPMFNGTYLV